MWFPFTIVKAHEKVTDINVQVCANVNCMQHTIMIRFLIQTIEKLERVAPRGRSALKSAAGPGLKNITGDTKSNEITLQYS